jgi:hypothetical protein
MYLLMKMLKNSGMVRRLIWTIEARESRKKIFVIGIM